MKKLLLLTVMLMSINAFTQTTTSRKTLADEKDFKVYESVTGQDTSVYYYFSFQNQKYQHISDLASILLIKKDDVTLLSQQLKQLGESSEKQTLTHNARYYSLSVYDFTENIYLTDSKGKYKTLTKKQALDISEKLLLYIQLLKQ